MFTFFSQTFVLILRVFRNMPDFSKLKPVATGVFATTFNFQKEGGSSVNLIYLVPDAKPVNPVKIPYKLLYHK